MSTYRKRPSLLSWLPWQIKYLRDVVSKRDELFHSRFCWFYVIGPKARHGSDSDRIFRIWNFPTIFRLAPIFSESTVEPIWTEPPIFRKGRVRSVDTDYKLSNRLEATLKFWHHGIRTRDLPLTGQFLYHLSHLLTLNSIETLRYIKSLTADVR